VRYFVFIIYLVFTFACNSNKDKAELRFSRFKHKAVLKSTILDLPYKGRHPGRIFAKFDSLIVFHNIYALDSLFSVYSINKSSNQLSPTVRFATVGGAEDEISQSGFAYFDKINNAVWINDSGKRQVIKYDLKNINNGRLQIPSSVVKFPQDIGLLMFFGIEDDHAIVAQTFDNPNHSIVRIIDSLQFHVPHILDKSTDLGDFFSQYYYFFGLHENKKKAIIAYANYEVVRIIDINSWQYITLYGPNKQQLEDHDLSHNIYRGPIVAKGNYIFVPFVNKPKNSGFLNLAETIHVFSLDGKPFAHLKLPDPIYSFDVDLNEKRIYAAVEDENETFVYYELPDFF
jgi:hypothetical protein